MCGVALENEIATALGALEGSQIMRGFARNLARQLQNAEGHISKKGYCKKSKELLQQMLTDVLDKETERKESSEEEEGDETESDVEMEELEEPGDEVEAEDQLEPDVEDRQLPLIVEVFNLLKDFGLLRYCRFQVVRYMRRLHEHLTLRLVQVADRSSCPKLMLNEVANMLGGGVTQSRKTMIKFVTMLLGHKMGVAQLIVTTGTRGRDSLFTKLMEYNNRLPISHRVPFFKINGVGRDAQTERVQCLLDAGCLMINDSAGALKKAKKLLGEALGQRLVQRLGQAVLEAVPFVAIIDEADAMRRTPNNELQLEKALAKLLGEDGDCDPPLVVIKISATLVPLFFELRHKQVNAQDIVFVERNHDYIGVADLQPLTHPSNDEKCVFLRSAELTKKNMYCNQKVEWLYKDAAKNPKSLLLDVSSPSVYAGEANIFQKADRMQRMSSNWCLHDGESEEEIRHHTFVGVVIWGAGVAIKYNIGRPWIEYKGKEKLSVAEVLAKIDRTVRMRRPVIVVGYSQMIRGDSFRTSQRVPSHMLNALGNAMSIEKLVQSVGRSTGEQKGRLQKNGFDHVTLLMRHNDFDTVQSIPYFQQELRRKLECSTSLDAALGAAYSWRSDFTFGTNRLSGQKKLGLAEEVSKLSFEPAPAGAKPGVEWRDSLEQDAVEATKCETLERALRRISVEKSRKKMLSITFHTLLEEDNNDLEDSRRTWEKLPRDGMTAYEMAEHLEVDATVYHQFLLQYKDFAGSGRLLDPQGRKCNIRDSCSFHGLRFDKGTEFPSPDSGDGHDVSKATVASTLASMFQDGVMKRDRSLGNRVWAYWLPEGEGVCGACHQGNIGSSSGGAASGGAASGGGASGGVADGSAASGAAARTGAADGSAALYKVLELPERKLATESEIKKAYHKMSLKWHPDKHPDNQEEAQERFIKIKAAYELLVEGLRTGFEEHAVGSAAGGSAAGTGVHQSGLAGDQQVWDMA
jgi:hypothetical protein